MKTYKSTYRPGLRRALFESCSEANTVDASEANAIARKHGLTQDDVRADLEQANKYGADQIATNAFCAVGDEERSQLCADHSGRYYSARHLFEGYCYESARVSRCESAESARLEEEYR